MSAPSTNGRRGSLVAVGTGIRTVGQMTVEAIAWIRDADKVLYVVGDPVGEALIQDLNPDGAESLATLYGEGKPRLQTYEEMVERILQCVREGYVTCVACYGHPGVFVYPSHHAIRRAREEGYEARMLPGVSAEDCLFADLGIDPGMQGCQSYEATDFLANNRQIDPTSVVVLWQIGVVGDATFKSLSYDQSAFPLLLERLLRIYPPEHTVYLYEAAIAPGADPTIQPVTLQMLGYAPKTAAHTLCIPPAYAPSPDPVVYARLQQLAPSPG